MKLFGLNITKAAPANAMPVSNRGGWWPIIRESFTGAWQQNVEVKYDSVLSNPTAFRCISLVSSDIAKMRCRLVQMDNDGIWSEAENPAYSPVLKRPNRFQNRIQFMTSWVESKLTQGNAVILKQRDNRGIVTALYVLDWCRVTPLVAPDGSVFYQLKRDDLAGIGGDLPAVPASEVIHDRWNTLFHPLIGLSPIFACGLAAIQGLSIQNNSTRFFTNGSNPGGILTAPGAISTETADRLKTHWDANYSGANVGKVAVLGDGLKYEPMAVKAVDAQLIEQLKWSAETVCSVFGVPAYKVGVGAAPSYNNIESLDAQYYAQCLQIHIESIELCLDEGLGLSKPYGTEFDLDDLLRMDTKTQMDTLKQGDGIMTPDEQRKKLNLRPVKGGNTVYKQQQDYSLEALAKRDAQADPFGAVASADSVAETDSAANDNAAELEAAKALIELQKGLLNVRR